VRKIDMKKKVMYNQHLCKRNTYTFNEQVLILKKVVNIIKSINSPCSIYRYHKKNKPMLII